MSLERVCYDCGRRTAEPVARCDCGEPLWLATDPGSFDWDDVADAPGLWRYESLLPVVPDPLDGLATAAGDTPLFGAPELDAFAGVRTHVKVEGQQPTGSFKDRGSALGLAAVREGAVGDVDAVGTVSHGNMAMSTAAFAAAAGVPCTVLVPADIPEERLGIIAQYDPTLLRVEGDYGRLYRRSLELGPERGVAFLNSDAPLRVEGQKTTAVEICEAFAPDVPDAVVLPVSSGGHASGAWKALRELRAAGTIDDIPPLYLVQAAACAPIAEAFAAGDDAVTPVEGGDTIAYSIANADPPSGTRALRAARDTGGGALAVDDDAIRAAQRALATEAGLSAESASAVALAGARRLAEGGELSSGDDVVVVVTGTGLKLSGGAASVPTVSIDELDAELAGAGERAP
ncbi:pyridoxal-phosphate dependent enzyme [Halostella sp. JP-L12]|uniref:threonine synthase n=1 Tax=Halostella TaxID=1843185 RepID=UPI000EF77A42|nr:MULTISPECIES: pyridoxal-phosphate dependent enzyme [Halostella]NHN46632.1 pyridoxal-phosphate dependent enzyme [Halostella sp. JP-L12]